MIPSLLVTVPASDLEKAIEAGGALSGRVSTNLVVKACGALVPAETDTDVKPKKKEEDVAKGGPGSGVKGHRTFHSGDEVEHTGDHQVIGGRKYHEFVYLEGHKKGQKGVMPAPEDKAKDVKAAQDEWKDQQAGFRRLRESQKKSVSQALDDLTKSFKRQTLPKPGAKVRKPEKDALQKKQERAQRKAAGLTKGDPLLVNTHGEQFHVDADKETVEFLTSTGAVLPDDPVHNPPVTPELNGFPLAVPLLYCSLPESDLIKSDDETALMQKAFNW